MMASGALVALPSWAKEWTADSLSFPSSVFAPAEQQLLASVVDALIPAGDSIGALSLGVDQFLIKLFDQCYEKEIQENINHQLDQLNQTAKSVFEKDFSDCDQQQRQELLLRLASSESKNEKDFFNLIKSETIRGFTTSREVMVNYLHYKQVPGHYYGCVDVKA
ncbi:MAG: gluconate 2-dehydrogenase subunit 3 family protein [Cyclobacteriaceae bacterium]|nr:gluconate 2-dehydrogenase subunit 3 family protein [Cyclobacteriaceae bacterium]